MNIGEAVRAMKRGRLVTRPGWNDKGMWIGLVPTAPLVAPSRDEQHSVWFVPNDPVLVTDPKVLTPSTLVMSDGAGHVWAAGRFGCARSSTDAASVIDEIAVDAVRDAKRLVLIYDEAATLRFETSAGRVCEGGKILS